MLKKLVKVVKGETTFVQQFENTVCNQVEFCNGYFICEDDSVYIIPIIGVDFDENGKYKYKTHSHIKLLSNNSLCIYEESTGMEYHKTEIVEGSVVDVVQHAL